MEARWLVILKAATSRFGRRQAPPGHGNSTETQRSIHTLVTSPPYAWDCEYAKSDQEKPIIGGCRG